MRNTPARDKFWEYLAKKLGQEKANEFVYTPDKSKQPTIYR